MELISSVAFANLTVPVPYSASNQTAYNTTFSQNETPPWVRQPHRGRYGYDPTWFQKRQFVYKSQMQSRLPYIVVTLAVIKVMCFIYLGKVNYSNRPLDVDVSWLRNLNRRAMFWRYQEERDRFRPLAAAAASSRRNSRPLSGGPRRREGCLTEVRTPPQDDGNSAGTAASEGRVGCRPRTTSADDSAIESAQDRRRRRRRERRRRHTSLTDCPRSSSSPRGRRVDRDSRDLPSYSEAVLVLGCKTETSWEGLPPPPPYQEAVRVADAAAGENGERNRCQSVTYPASRLSPSPSPPFHSPPPHSPTSPLPFAESPATAEHPPPSYAADNDELDDTMNTVVVVVTPQLPTYEEATAPNHIEI